MSKYGVNLRIKSKYRKIRIRKNSVFGHFSLNVLGYLSGATDHWSIDPTHPINPYILKQMSFSDLINSCTMTFEQSFAWAVGRFNFAWIEGLDMFCLACQSVSLYNKFQEV